MSKEITLEGNLSIERALELRDQLLNTVENTREIVFKFKRVTCVDLSFLQLLYSTCRAASETQTVLSFANSIPDILQKKIDQAGFSHQFQNLVSES